MKPTNQIGYLIAARNVVTWYVQCQIKKRTYLLTISMLLFFTTLYQQVYWKDNIVNYPEQLGKPNENIGKIQY